MIRLTCECGRQLEADARHAGSTAACPACGRPVEVPEFSALVGYPSQSFQERSADGVMESPPGDQKRFPDIRRKISRKAVAGFLLTIPFGILCFLPYGVQCREAEANSVLAVAAIGGALAMALAYSARNEIRQAPHELRGEALAGISLVALPICLVLNLLSPRYICILRAPHPNIQALNSLKELGLAFKNYRQDHGQLPGSAIRSPDGKPLLSWRVALLTYVEGEELLKLFHLDEPWDSPHNLALLPNMPAVYSDGQRERSEGLTRFQVYVGPGSAFESPGGHVLADLARGVDRTLLVTEGEQFVPWTQPIDLPFGPEVVLMRPHVRNLSVGAGSWALSADGAVHRIPPDCPEETLRALIDRGGHDAVAWP